MLFRSLLLLFPILASAAPPAAVPHLDSRGQAAYQSFLNAATPRAFAIAPGGAYAWAASAVSEDAAETQALESCRRHGEQTCVLFAVNEQRVFDGKRWPTLWGPYPDAAASARAAVGMKRGMRFPDLALSDAAARKLRLSDLDGRVRVLHFWGSWCPHCRQEMPGFQRLAKQLRKEKIAFALIQVREDVASARAWLRRQKIAMPLYDSGVRGSRDAALPLAGGGMLADREIARAFPATYILGRHGVVLFSHTGPVSDWSQYAEFLRHAARP
ncbi:MAG: redoxin domain-containing protein [Pseudomonadota bacterium]|nr:redoxin domain-containing protein [Pseudomonadota bacterium]MDP1903861.1 redoxin domain-containing protein [Pseudomonadota bacterium]MDP2353641.1 redoxin domain-containing protein [Pseudomonadota bacterium]